MELLKSYWKSIEDNWVLPVLMLKEGGLESLEKCQLTGGSLFPQNSPWFLASSEPILLEMVRLSYSQSWLLPSMSKWVKLIVILKVQDYHHLESWLIMMITNKDTFLFLSLTSTGVGLWSPRCSSCCWGKCPGRRGWWWCHCWSRLFLHRHSHSVAHPSGARTRYDRSRSILYG